VATAAAISFSFAMAIAGGFAFGHAVTDDDPVGTIGPNASRAVSSVRPEERDPDPEPWPPREVADAATRIAQARAGIVSFAAVGPGREEIGFEPERQFYSASVSKAMLLVAELRRLAAEGEALDESTRTTLEQMITLSDNDAADAIYARVGDPGLNAVAKLAGMTNFGGDIGHWSNVKVTAADMASFMFRLDRLLDVPNGDAGSEMLASVISSQAWGIPQAAPEDALVRFKGGWRPGETGQLVHQAAAVSIDGDTYAIAVLTDGNPDQAYGRDTIRMVADALFRDGR
jgi:hypothetical protein